MRTLLLVAFLCLASACTGSAATLEIPSQYQDLASALDFALPGDTLLLDSGTYSGPGFTNLQFDLPGELTISSPQGAANTVVDLQGSDFLILGYPESDSISSELNLVGLSLINGHTALEVASPAHLTAVNCLFSGNTMAVLALGPEASAALQWCSLVDNEYTVVLDDKASLTVTDSYFRSSYCGVWAYPETTVDIRRSMFIDHDWTLVFEGGIGDISTSLLYMNFVGIKGSDTLESDISVSCSNVYSRFSFNYASTPDQTGLNGNISRDPFFCDTTDAISLEVSGISPLLPENNECGLMMGHVTVGCCCIGGLGNVNYDTDDAVDIADIQALIDNLFLSLTPVACPEEADLNYDLGLDITDLQVLIDNQFLTLTPLGTCP